MYNLAFGQNVHFSKKNQPKEPCKHFGQVEPFEKSWFPIVKGDFLNVK